MPEDYLPGAVLDVTWDGQRYGVPLDVNALVLLANGDLLEAAGVSRKTCATSRTSRATPRARGAAGRPTTRWS
jgi:ABC-type glycerol-3-phosphate transport system substrate-binding protein